MSTPYFDSVNVKYHVCNQGVDDKVIRFLKLMFVLVMFPPLTVDILILHQRAYLRFTQTGILRGGM